jgi:hypothetical protein
VPFQSVAPPPTWHGIRRAGSARLPLSCGTGTFSQRGRASASGDGGVNGGTEGMKFFIPKAESAEKAQALYEAIRTFLSEQGMGECSERRIFRLQWRHDGKPHRAEIGKDTSINREVVFAILHRPEVKLYYVCTTNSGVLRGTPVLAAEATVTEVVDFVS